MSRPRRDAPARSQDAAARIVVGIHPVREILRAGHKVHRVRLADSRGGSAALDEIIELARKAGVPVVEVRRSELDDVAAGLVHQGVVAEAAPLVTVSPDQIVALAIARAEPALIVAIDGVTDPHNLGSIARTAEAAGAHGLIVPSRRSAGITPTVEKAAAGALAHLPVAVVTNLVRTLADLARDGVWSLGLDGDAEVTVDEHPLVAESCVLVVGAEGDGLSRLTRERCDGLVRLPMRGQVDSLNASVAAGIALYTIAARQGRPA
ncbi:MAG: 23S rRNA (guanosine(2251)-2'-O)-methyltransferase RlmB [Nitriliruptoraceae bacterium]